MNQTRKYATQHGAALAMSTHKDNLYLTDLVSNGEVIDTGRVIRLDRSTSRWLAQPACGCEDMSFDTLGDATCCLANHAMNTSTHSLMYHENTAKYLPVLIQEPAPTPDLHAATLAAYRTLTREDCHVRDASLAYLNAAIAEENAKHAYGVHVEREQWFYRKRSHGGSQYPNHYLTLSQISAQLEQELGGVPPSGGDCLAPNPASRPSSWQGVTDDQNARMDAWQHARDLQRADALATLQARHAAMHPARYDVTNQTPPDLTGCQPRWYVMDRQRVGVWVFSSVDEEDAREDAARRNDREATRATRDRAHVGDFDCEECQHEGCSGTSVYYGSCLTHTDNPHEYSFSQLHGPTWNARLAARATRDCDRDECHERKHTQYHEVVETQGHSGDALIATIRRAQATMNKAAVTAALAVALMCASNASAQELPLVPTDGECAITRMFEDGSATALCGHDVWAYDADGGFILDHGIVFFYRAPGTWYHVVR